jgi:hypothetical protein
MLYLKNSSEVEAGGVERERGAIVNLLMARDFWG